MKNHFVYFKAGLLFLFVVAVFWYVSVYSRSVGAERSFSVSGSGKVVAVPDIAKAGKFRLGKLISIQEGFVSPYYPVSFEGRGGVGPLIEPGSQEIAVNVTLVYEIK